MHSNINQRDTIYSRKRRSPCVAALLHRLTTRRQISVPVQLLQTLPGGPKSKAPTELSVNRITLH